MNQSLLDWIMLSRIIYCSAVVLATTAVILLALFSPLPHRTTTSPVALSFYIQQPQPSGSATAPPSVGALVFHRWLTEGPENTSRVVGKAQGFIIPVEGFAHSAFNIIYLTLHTHGYSGSVSIEARNLAFKEEEELSVVGGTGSFAFANGNAVFAHMGRHPSNMEASYHIKLHLDFPDNFGMRWWFWGKLVLLYFCPIFSGATYYCEKSDAEWINLIRTKSIKLIKKINVRRRTIISITHFGSEFPSFFHIQLKILIYICVIRNHSANISVIRN